MYGAGISHEGELIELGAAHGIIDKAGAWYSYNGERIGQGKDNTRVYLQQHADIAADIEEKLRAKLLPQQPKRAEEKTA
jgi:recombination protein RecA